MTEIRTHVSYSHPVVKVLQLILQSYGTVLIGLMVGVISARALSVATRGELAILLLIVQLLSRLASLGFEQSIQRKGINKYANYYYSASLMGGILATPIALFALILLHIPVYYATICIVMIPVVTILRVNISHLIYREKIGFLTALNTFQALLQLLSYAIISYKPSLDLFLIAWSVTVTIASIVSFVMLRRLEGISLNSGDLNLKGILKTWELGSRYIGMVVPEIALTFCLELPVVRLVLGGTQAGLYAISNTVTNIFYQLFVALSSIYIKYDHRRPPVASFFLLAVVGLGIFLGSGIILRFAFGEKYVDARHFIHIMLPTVYLLGVLRIFQTSDRSSQVSGFQIVSSIILVISIFLGGFVEKSFLVFWIVFCYSGKHSR